MINQKKILKDMQKEINKKFLKTAFNTFFVMTTLNVGFFIFVSHYFSFVAEFFIIVNSFFLAHYHFKGMVDGCKMTVDYCQRIDEGEY